MVPTRAPAAGRFIILALGLGLLGLGLVLQVVAWRRGPAPASLAGALDALEGPDARDALPALRRIAAGRPDPDVLREVLRALERIGGEEAALLVHDLGRAEPSLQDEAALRLSRIEGRDAAPALHEIIEREGGKGPFAAAAARALGRAGLRSAVPALANLAASTPDPAVKRGAADALGLIADPDGLPSLLPLLGDPDPAVRRQAIRAVGRIRSPLAVEGLEAFLARTPGPAPPEERLAREALARLRGEPPP
jgi:HEAT repeat protein